MTDEERIEYNKIITEHNYFLTEMNKAKEEARDLQQKCLDKDYELSNLNKKIRRYEEMINSILAAGQMITQHKEQFDKLRGVE